MSDETAYEDEPDTLPGEMSPVWREADELIEQYEALADPEPETPRMFDAAAQVVVTALETVRSTLALLRAQRLEINAEIRRLVGEEDQLARMARIAERASTATEEEGDQP